MSIYNCKEFHDSCSSLLFEKLFSMIKYSIKLYSILHLLPFIVTKSKQIKQNFKESILEVLKKLARSVAYLTTYILIYRSSFCLISKFFGKYTIILNILQSLLMSPAILFESNDRIRDNAFLTLPKSLAGLFITFNKTGYIPEIKFGMCFIFALSLTSLMWLKDKKEIAISNYEKAFDYYLN